MKKIKHLSLVPIMLIAFMGILSCSNDEPVPIADGALAKTRAIVLSHKIDSAYSFKSIEDPEVWKTLHSLRDQQKACQIPDNILEQMTTKALVETCMNYPLRGIFYAYNDELKGLQVIIEGFNGLLELSQREDAPKYLLEYYGRMIEESSKAQSGVENEPTINCIDFGFMDLLLSYPINEGLYKEETLPKLNDIVEKAHAFKLSHPDCFGELSLMRGLKSGKNKKAKRNTPSSVITIYTHNGYSVQGIVSPELFTPYEKNQIDQGFILMYPNATFVSSTTTTYNCHSFAWNMSDGGTTCWINATIYTINDNLGQYWSDGYYWPTIQENGNKVYFAGADHSAICWGIDNNTYKSKWGSGPLMIHSFNECPYYEDTELLCYYNSYFVQHDGEFDFNSPDVAFEIGESRVFTPRLYFDNTNLVFNWDVTTMKEDGPSVVGTIASITLLNGGRSARISFSQAGMYRIICRVTLNGSLHAEMSYEAIVDI